ncbi:DUF5753 domain-containing protein [Amycolatopsis sp. cmx-4-68]|uniref:DUF5753 domain-containing protein n=1 Tax=Amycolatopsis sp. cmx-4-68 TaxID=2790938 RepID=UPI003979D185
MDSTSSPTASGSTAAKLSRIENGKRTASEGDVAKILGNLGVNGEKYDELMAIARGADTDQWLATRLPEQRAQNAAIVDFESRAAAITEWAPALIPGLVQVAGYARAIMTSDEDVPAGDVATRVALRMGRRETIDPARTSKPARFLALIDEAALRRNIGGPQVMAEQLEHLLQVADWENAQIQVVPVDAGWHPGLAGQFQLIEPNASEGFPIVYLETRRSGLILHTEEDVAAYRKSIDAVLRVAMTPAQSAEAIAAATEEMRNPR